VNMDENINLEQQEQAPSCKELVLDYKDKTTNSIVRFFNVSYVILTLIQYLYYVFYVTYNILKNGLDYPISILFLVAVVIYTAILVACAIMSSTMKSARKRIKKSMKAFRYLKRSITIISSIVAIIALITAIQSDTLEGWTLFISIFSLILNFIKIVFSLLLMFVSTGVTLLKISAKQGTKYIKKQKALYDEQKKN